MELDIETYDKLYHISWIDALSYLACKNGNNWSGYKKSQLDSMLEELGDMYTIDDLMKENKYYSYYKQIFSAMLGGFLSEYEKQIPDHILYDSYIIGNTFKLGILYQAYTVKGKRKSRNTRTRADRHTNYRARVLRYKCRIS